MPLLSTAAGRGIILLLSMLAIASLLDAEGLRKQAQIQPQGFERRVALDATWPLVRVSRTLHLTTPRHELQVAIGRQGEDAIDTQVHLSLPPPATLPPPRKPRRTHHAPPPPPKPVFTAAHPLRVWVAGDSLAQIPGEALERVGGAIDVVGIESRLATGLARPDLYNWFSRIPQAVKQLRPRLVVFSFGADDAHGFMTGVPAGRTLGPLGSSSWDAEYLRRADGVTRELIAQGVYVVWLGLPIPDGPGFRKSFPILNTVIGHVVRMHPRSAAYVDTWHLLDDAHGRYTAYLRVHGTLTMMRLPDGVHYTSAAGDLIVRQLLAQLRGVYLLR
jgi:hypothetical protein